MASPHPGNRPLDNVSQSALSKLLRLAVDSARIAHPLRGTNPVAFKAVRRLIRENPRSVRSFKVLYNIGAERRDWLLPLIEDELGVPMAELERWDPRKDPWLDDVRANGPVVGGHLDREIDVGMETEPTGLGPDAETAKLQS